MSNVDPNAPDLEIAEQNTLETAMEQAQVDMENISRLWHQYDMEEDEMMAEDLGGMCLADD